MTKQYLNTVARIRNVRWDLADTSDLLSLMLLGAYTAEEFAESLRIATRLKPSAFEEMARGELDTTNIQFDDYVGPGDHSAYLWHFIEKHGVCLKCSMSVRLAGERYVQFVRRLPEPVRLMSIVSREQELPGIFSAILKAPGWNDLPELEAYRHYLSEHIRLDSGSGGHADLLSSLEVDDSVSSFWEARLQMYCSIPGLMIRSSAT